MSEEDVVENSHFSYAEVIQRQSRGTSLTKLNYSKIVFFVFLVDLVFFVSPVRLKIKQKLKAETIAAD